MINISTLLELLTRICLVAFQRKIITDSIQTKCVLEAIFSEKGTNLNLNVDKQGPGRHCLQLSEKTHCKSQGGWPGRDRYIIIWKSVQSDKEHFFFDNFLALVEPSVSNNCAYILAKLSYFTIKVIRAESSTCQSVTIDLIAKLLNRILLQVYVF